MFLSCDEYFRKASLATISSSEVADRTRISLSAEEPHSAFHIYFVNSMDSGISSHAPGDDEVGVMRHPDLLREI